jgi:ribonuclease HI
MYFDGSLNLEGAGVGVLFISPQGNHLKYLLQIHYKASNNDTEYEALIHGLCITVSLGIKRLITYGDSKVVTTKSTRPATSRRIR